MPQYISHLLSFIIPVSTCLFLVSGPHDTGTALLWTLPFWIILIMDWRGPKLTTHTESPYSKKFYDSILYGLSLLQLGNIGLMLFFINTLTWNSFPEIINSLVNLIVLRFLVGTSSGTSGIVVAHELIHRRQWIMQHLGRLLLCTVFYEHFIITHKRGHHLNLGMPDDIATARLGESFKDYWKRIYIGYLRYAWHSELDRLGIRQCPYQFKLLYNHVLQGLILEAAFLLIALIFFGWLAAIMLIYQAFAAVRILEAVNYFQHWGLIEGQFGNSFGWVTDSFITRYVLIGLSNHIGHHQNEKRHFHEISFSDQGPKLPYGYFVMNLWVKLGNTSFQKMALRELKHFQESQAV